MSAIFSPLIIPTYCTVMAMWLTPLQSLPEDTRLLASLVILVLTGILPLLILITLMRMGRLKDLDISDRRQRLQPLIYVLVCYGVAVAYMHHVHAPWWLVMYYVSGCITALVVALISLWWKISAHGSAMGNMTAMMAALILGDYTELNLTIWVCVAILLTGLVGTSRLILQRHTVLQVYAGILLSAGITGVCMLWDIFKDIVY